MRGEIWFLDLARKTGFCGGVPGGEPEYFTHKLAPDGSEPMAVAGGIIEFLGKRLNARRPQMVVYEAPIDPRHMKGKTNLATARMLMGLPFAVEGICYRFGVYNVREATSGEVRKFLLGKNPREKNTAKRAVIQHLHTLGFDPEDDNAADALAGWLYSCAIVDSRVGAKSTRLFGAR